MNHILAMVIPALAWTLPLASAEAPALYGNGYSLVREGMPNVSQRDSSFVGGGKTYCGPASASNALMWLANRGFPNLKPIANGDDEAQQNMIRRLAELMGTHRDGTPLFSFQCGINTYLRSTGHADMTWTVSGSLFKTAPDIQTVSAISDERTVAWLGLGRYVLDGANNKYRRTSGHLVVLAGYGNGSLAGVGIDRLLVVDSDQSGGYSALTLHPLPSCKITNGKNSIQGDAFYSLRELGKDGDGADSKITVLESIQTLTIR